MAVVERKKRMLALVQWERLKEREKDVVDANCLKIEQGAYPIIESKFILLVHLVIHMSKVIHSASGTYI